MIRPLRKATRAMGALTNNTAFQENICMRRPPRTGPPAMPRLHTADQMASATQRIFSVYLSTTTFLTT